MSVELQDGHGVIAILTLQPDGKIKVVGDKQRAGEVCRKFLESEIRNPKPPITNLSATKGRDLASEGGQSPVTDSPKP